MPAVPLAQARAQLSKPVDDAVRTHERVEVMRNGRRAAVILSADNYDIVGDAATMAEVRQAEADLAAGKTSSLEDVEAEIGSHARVTYRIELAPAARRALTHSLPKVVATACANFLHDVLAVDPYRVGEPLRDELAGRYSARRVEFRVLSRT